MSPERIAARSVWLSLCALVVQAGCQTRPQGVYSSVADGSSDIADGRSEALVDAPLDTSACQPLICQTGPLPSCGTFADGCGGTLDCGACPKGLSCNVFTSNVCGTPKGPCTAVDCTQAGGTYCGVIGDGCGSTKDCGSCAPPLTCGGRGTISAKNICGAMPGSVNCTSTDCNAVGVRYCGLVGDGCGGAIDCGNCPSGQSCGGDGLANVCGSAPDSGACTPTNCTQGQYRYCGVIGDGCGGKVDCGGCSTGQGCGAGGIEHLCGYAPDSGACVATTCIHASDRYCGVIGDGCGGKVDCGGCPGAASCGGGGLERVCGYAPDTGGCTRTLCAQAGGQYCGVISDGCGGKMDCGGCPTGQSCGGRGMANLCGAPTGTPGCGTCATASGNYCGTIGDGCGGTLTCDAQCPTGQTCGARSPNVCDAPCPLCAQVAQCDAGMTTLSGTVYTGALTNPDPVYNALVYIPNLQPGQSLPALVAGPTCDRCAPLTPDQAIASAITGPDGSFKLNYVPTGNVTVVVQLGKWRRVVTVPVTPCINNMLPAGTVRLPRDHTDGDIPLMAISTGTADSIECVLRKMGISDSEFTIPGGGGRINLYHNNGSIAAAGATPDQAVLWGGAGPNGGVPMSSYDVVLLPCDGINGDGPIPPAYQNLVNFTTAGGRALVTHYSQTWIKLMNTVPPKRTAFPETANWVDETKYFGTYNNVNYDFPVTAMVNTGFQKGADFAQWLVNVGASAVYGSIPINHAVHNIDTLLTNTGAQAWLTSPLQARQYNPTTMVTQQFIHHYTFNTPVGSSGDNQCGRVVYSSFHVNDTISLGTTFPAECTSTTFSAQEKVIEFMLLDLESCIQTNAAPPPPAPPPPPSSPFSTAGRSTSCAPGAFASTASTASTAPAARPAARRSVAVR